MPEGGSMNIPTSRGTGFFWFIRILFFMANAATLPVFAQVFGGTLVGTLTDSQHAAVANARIEIRNMGTGVVRSATTNEAGIYTAPDLLPGTYDVSAAAPGFARSLRTGVLITVGSQDIIDLTLMPGPAVETVIVKASDQVAPLPLVTSDLSVEISGQVIRQLPLNGRSWTDLAILQPGVSAISNQPSFVTGGDRGTRGFGSQLSISGGRPQQNNYRIDGVSINGYANGGPGSVLGGNLGVDAVQEFSVITTNAPAEYGKTSGGIVNATTRSGTNELHGAVYEFLRNSAFDAQDYFNSGPAYPFKRNQFGGAIGGPIHKDRNFFFANYEGLRQAQEVASTAIVPSANARNGLLQNADGSTTQVTVDSAVAKYLVFWPTPSSNAAVSGNTSLYTFGGHQVVNENFVEGRFDQNFTSKDSAFASYMYDHAPYMYPDSLNDVLLGSTTVRQVVVLGEDHIFGPRLLNSIRFGVNRETALNDVDQSALNSSATDKSLGTIPGEDATAIAVAGLTAFTGGMSASGNKYHWTSWQLYDDGFFTKGRHSFKFGGSTEYMQLNIYSPSDPSGQFLFGSIIGFLTNQPTQYNAGLPGTVTPRDLRDNIFAGYLQDDWRFTKRWTFNIGLRYEAATVLREAADRLSALHNLSDATPHLGNPFFQNPTLKNFEPRVGFAWDPFGSGTTALRGAFGIYDVLPLPYLFILPTTSAAPFTEMGVVKGNKLPAGSFYTGAEALLGPSSLRATYVQPNPKRNYVMQYHLDLEHEFIKGLHAVASYVGSHGVHQPYYSNQFDIVMPTLTAQGYFWPTPIGSGTPINPNYGSIRGLMWTGNSSFNGLEVGIHEQIHSLLLQASYTWSKSIDNSSASLAPDAFGNSVAVPPFFSMALSRGLSDFNMSRVLAINSIWTLPSLHSSATSRWLTNGWQIGGIFRASDGIPFTPTFGSDGDPMGSGGLQDFPDRLTGTGCGSLTNPGSRTNYVKTDCFTVPTATGSVLAMCDHTYGTGSQCFNLLGNAGRNTLIGPGLADFDALTYRTFRLTTSSERYIVQFRAEAFNVLNHPNFSTPANTDIFDSTGAPTGTAGLLTSTSLNARQIQFGVRTTW
jgi:hypothetical protein